LFVVEGGLLVDPPREFSQSRHWRNAQGGPVEGGGKSWLKGRSLSAPLRGRKIETVGNERSPSHGLGWEAGIKRAVAVQERVNDAHWSFAMALAWVTCRTEQAVINIKGDAGWGPTEAAIRDLLSALRSGKLIAHGMFEGEQIPHPIETAVWSTFEIVVEPMMFVGHMFLPTSGTPVVIAQRMGPPQTQLLSPTVPAAKIRKLWPAAKQTAAAEGPCRQYLVTEAAPGA
jgi:hypothetical protein